MGEPQWVLALIMHLRPTFALLVITGIAWKHEKMGGLLFLIAAFLMFYLFHSLLLAALPLVIGLLFLVGTYTKKTRSQK